MYDKKYWPWPLSIGRGPETTKGGVEVCLNAVWLIHLNSGRRMAQLIGCPEKQTHVSYCWNKKRTHPCFFPLCGDFPHVTTDIIIIICLIIIKVCLHTTRPVAGTTGTQNSPFSSLAITVASTHCAYPWRDGQAELAWVVYLIPKTQQCITSSHNNSKTHWCRDADVVVCV